LLLLQRDLQQNFRLFSHRRANPALLKRSKGIRVQPLDQRMTKGDVDGLSCLTADRVEGGFNSGRCGESTTVRLAVPVADFAQGRNQASHAGVSFIDSRHGPAQFPKRRSSGLDRRGPDSVVASTHGFPRSICGGDIILLGDRQALLGRGGRSRNFTQPALRLLQLCRERWPDAFGAGIKAIRDFAKPADLGVKRAGLSSTRSWPKLFQRGYRLLCFVKALAGAVKAFDSLGERYPCRRNWF